MSCGRRSARAGHGSSPPPVPTIVTGVRIVVRSPIGTVPPVSNVVLGALKGVISLVTHNRAMQVAALVAGTARFLVDSDPGRLRLRSAAATTLSLVIAIVAMLAFTRVAHQPVTVAMLGTIVAMQSSAAVKDRQQHSRVVTMLLLFFPAVGAVALGGTSVAVRLGR